MRVDPKLVFVLTVEGFAIFLGFGCCAGIALESIAGGSTGVAQRIVQGLYAMACLIVLAYVFRRTVRKFREDREHQNGPSKEP